MQMGQSFLYICKKSRGVENEKARTSEAFPASSLTVTQLRCLREV